MRSKGSYVRREGKHCFSFFAGPPVASLPSNREQDKTEALLVIRFSFFSASADKRKYTHSLYNRIVLVTGLDLGE